VAGRWLLYGAYGYTGRLIAEEAASRGLDPILAGRRSEPLLELAGRLELDHRVASLDDPAALANALDGIDLVLHCAGPFIETGPPMMQACIEAGVHYLDLTGESDVFAAAFDLDDEARAAGVLLLPGCGFDVVPTDCLAACLAERQPDATHLYLAFEGQGGISPGTAKSSILGLLRGGRIRRNGELVTVPLGYHHRTIDFGGRRRTVVTIPFGDVFTPHVSTAIPNIEVYMSVPQRTVKRLRRLRWLAPLLAVGPLRRMLLKRVGRQIQGPDPEKRRRTNSFVWGQVRNEAGMTHDGRMLTPNSYSFTVSSALGIVEHVLEKGVPDGGFSTPSLLMGRDYASRVPGVLVTLS